ncbi:MAG TPA: C13 family peptidase [Rhizomicrobium sp.]
MAASGWLHSWLSTSFSGRHTSSSPPPSPETDWQRYGRWLRLILLIVFIVLAAIALFTSRLFASGYSNWAVAVVAGDWHAHDGSASEIFDNARRDVSEALERVGFNPSNVLQFSVRPNRYSDTHPLQADAVSITDSFSDLTSRARGGCLLYFSSHGSPDGLVLGATILSPRRLDAMITNVCDNRPTVVVLSACYSGVFVRPLQAPNRMIVTAARPDRTSFGCGAMNRYPYFDDCFLSSVDEVKDFRSLAFAAKACVRRMEKETGMSPPSEPQIFIGREVASQLPAWR